MFQVRCAVESVVSLFVWCCCGRAASICDRASGCMLLGTAVSTLQTCANARPPHCSAMLLQFRLALDLAAQCGVSLPTAQAANGVYLAAKEQGHGDEDFSAVVTAYASQPQKGAQDQK